MSCAPDVNTWRSHPFAGCDDLPRRAVGPCDTADPNNKSSCDDKYGAILCSPEVTMTRTDIS
jgi:hypothetical protein